MAEETTDNAPAPAESTTQTSEQTQDKNAEPLPHPFEKGLQQGKPVWLEAGGEKFFAIYMQETHGNTQGGIILLHDLGNHPDWPEVISPIRTRLPELGWSTLSIQMPVLEANANLDEYSKVFDKVPDRIKAAIDFLQKNNIGNIVIVGQGLGAAMGASYLVKAGNRSQSGITGFIGISMSAPEGIDERMNTPKLLENITVPVFDIYGELDDASVVLSAPERAAAAKRAGIIAYQKQSNEGLKDAPTAGTSLQEKSGSIAYRQIMIPGADSTFAPQTDLLLKRIRGWLQRHASGKRIAVP